MNVRQQAKRDIVRLKSNWLFVILASMTKTISLVCVLPTNHQFIINPTIKSLNITEEKIEPGLEQSEAFYSLAYVVLCIGHSSSAIAVGILFNFIPTWYLFLVTTLSHTLGYLLYALATHAWMMLLARGLTGLSLGAFTSLEFAYFGVSYGKYTENLKTLGKFEEEKAVKMKGYLFSSDSIGHVLGIGIGLGFPTILAQFPDTPQFRPAGWFCVAVGVALLLLQLVLFHGECTWHCSGITCDFTKKWHLFTRRKDQTYSGLFCQIFVPLYLVIFGGLKAIRYILHEVLLNPIASDSFGFRDKDITYVFLMLGFTCPLGTFLLYVLQYLRLKSFGLTVVGMLCTISSLLIMTDWQAIGTDLCTEHSLFHHPYLADEYRMELTTANVSESGLVSVQSLQVVEDTVYQMAVNRCESAGDHCHWIPNSQVTHKHCSDCQPICRGTRRTLNFVQFVVGMVFFSLTLPLAYTGGFLLLSETISKPFQGVGSGVGVALIGTSKAIFPLILDGVYEHEQKRTYLPMLIQVAIYLPLLVGLLLLYPWIKQSQLQSMDDTEGGKNENTGLLLQDSHLNHARDSG